MPAVIKVWLGFCSVELVLSPKFQFQLARDPPCRGLLWSEKRQATPTVQAGTVKAAVGGWLTGAVTVTDFVAALLRPVLSVTVKTTEYVFAATKVWFIVAAVAGKSPV